MRYNCKCEGNKTRRVFVISSNKYHKQQNERKQTIELEKKKQYARQLCYWIAEYERKKNVPNYCRARANNLKPCVFLIFIENENEGSQSFVWPMSVCVCVTQKRNILLPSKWIKNKNCSYTHEYRWIYGVLLYTHANPWNIVDTGMWLYALQANELNYFRMCINTAL